ncbi:MAG: hypothetical protein EHM34_02365 [Nitrosopumilales archaeon]|nr:MAG: hypothetical protein EHM34_02365 [Nitrosopumilales archaeon]
MKFGDIYNESTVGSFRVVSKFLWQPVTIDGQTRWLERAKIKQICKFYGEEFGYRWENHEWIDDERV